MLLLVPSRSVAVCALVCRCDGLRLRAEMIVREFVSSFFPAEQGSARRTCVDRHTPVATMPAIMRCLRGEILFQ
jgi:hypothetical protein